MMLWDQLVDLLRVMIIAYAQACGGNLGAGIVVFSMTLRVLLLPLTLGIARASREHQQAIEKLKPELERIRKRFRSKPERIGEETSKLFEEHNVSPVPLAGCLGTLAQMPLFIAVYAAVRQVVAAGGRFLWIGNIARPDMLLTVLVAGLTYASVAHSSSGLPQQGKAIAIFLPVIATLLVLARTSAGLGLYWGVSAAASLVQSILLKRSAAARATA